MTEVTADLEHVLEAIVDGTELAIPADYAGVAMAATRALVRRGIKRLRLVTVPVSSLQADLLIGAAAVAEIETSAVGFGELGGAPRFNAAAKAGAIRIKDATCPAIHAALRAGEMGSPFAALRGLIGSDILGNRADWRVIDNPFGANDPIVLLPALRPEVALFHAPLADRAGNVWIGRKRELMSMAHAAERTVVTVERIQEENLLLDEALAAATIPAFYVTAVALAPRGAWPFRCGSDYSEDTAHLREYLELAQTEAGFARYLERHVFSLRAA